MLHLDLPFKSSLEFVISKTITTIVDMAWVGGGGGATYLIAMLRYWGDSDVN